MNNQTNVPAATELEAQKTLKLVYEGKQLTKYVPKGQSPKLYIDLIKSQVMKPDKNGTPRSDSDLLLFLYVAKRTGLDPLTKQIYAVFRWDSRQGKEVMAIQAGIDGMRLVAQRTGDYAGQDEAKMLPEDESTPYPTKATVTVYKMVQGQKVAFTGSARWSEYAPTNAKGEVEFMWRKMPYTMLAKCAEALALRKGFPNELSGIYSEEEMRQVAPTDTQQISALPKPAKFDKKPEEPADNQIKVEHGAPSDGSADLPKTVTPENIDQFAGVLEGGTPDSPQLTMPGMEPPDANPPTQQLPTPSATGGTTPVLPRAQAKVVEMRQQVKAKLSVPEMQEKIKNMGKTHAVPDTEPKTD